MSLPTYHIWYNAADGRIPITLFVFGPYSPFSSPEWDVEIYAGTWEAEQRLGRYYVGTVSGLTRDTHVIADVWDEMGRMVNATDVG